VNSYIALGVVYENTVDSPLLSWSDPHLAYDISQVGLSTVGAAVLYGVECGLEPGLFYPEGTCRLDDQDCESLANTRCVKPAVPPGKLFNQKNKFCKNDLLFLVEENEKESKNVNYDSSVF
jgi:hypothetical protein